MANEVGAQYTVSCRNSPVRVGVPNGIRTRVAAVKGRCPRPLDDGDVRLRMRRDCFVALGRPPRRTDLYVCVGLASRASHSRRLRSLTRLVTRLLRVLLRCAWLVFAPAF